MAIFLPDTANHNVTITIPQPSAFTMMCFAARTKKKQCRPMNWGENMIEIERGANNDWAGIHYNAGSYDEVASAGEVVGALGYYYHFGWAVQDGDQEIYQDGLSLNTGSFSGAATYAFGALRAPNDDGARNFVGLAAEFAVWNRRLDSDTMLKIGHHRASPLYFPDGLILYSPCIDKHVNLIDGQTFDQGPHGIVGSVHPGGIDYPASSGLRHRAAPLSALIDADAAPGAIAGHL